MRKCKRPQFRCRSQHMHESSAISRGDFGAVGNAYEIAVRVHTESAVQFVAWCYCQGEEVVSCLFGGCMGKGVRIWGGGGEMDLPTIQMMTRSPAHTVRDSVHIVVGS